MEEPSTSSCRPHRTLITKFQAGAVRVALVWNRARPIQMHRRLRVSATDACHDPALPQLCANLQNGKCTPLKLSSDAQAFKPELFYDHRLQASQAHAQPCHKSANTKRLATSTLQTRPQSRNPAHSPMPAKQDTNAPMPSKTKTPSTVQVRMRSRTESAI